MPARRPVSRVLSRRPVARATEMAIHLGRRSPGGSSGRPEGWAARLSPGEPGCALLLGLAPGRVCRVSLRPPACAAARHRHCGTGPRLTADGRYPLPCAAELGLSSRPSRGCPRRGSRPSDRLADRPILPSPDGPVHRLSNGRSGSAPSDHERWTTGGDAVDRLVGERIGERVLGPRNVGRRPPRESRQGSPRLRVERNQLGVLDPPAAGELLDDELRVRQQVDFPGAQLGGQRQGADDAGVFGDVVGLDAEVFRDGRVRDGPRVAGVGP